MRFFQSLLIVVVFACSIHAQHTLSGIVTNANGEPLIQASVFFEGTYLASISDESGFYKIENIDSGTYNLKVSYVGYNSLTQEVDINADQSLDVNLGKNLLELQSIEINSTRVAENSAFAHTNLNSEQLNKENLGQDVPFLLRWTPSVVVTSDAGAGIGYTSIRMRGSDATRINVTINGVALNDSESQGVFWVDLPDFMSSVDNVQIQRGVGTSTNGAGAFGGTISLNTNKIHQNPYAHVNASLGSFATNKLAINLGTGLLNDKYTVDARYSVISSDGYIDRASSDLKSWYFSAARMGEKSSLRLLAFSGHERTYQSWNGTPESKITGTESDLQDHYDRNFYGTQDSINLFESDRRYNFYTYENQVDDYQQDHYQLHYTLAPNDKLKLNSTVHYTGGLGFFEEFKPAESYDGYSSINPVTPTGDTITNGDLVRRRWLNNDNIGIILGGEYQANVNTNVQFGGAISEYKGDHYGHVVSAQGIENVNLAQRYYEGTGDKLDANVYLKATHKVGKFDLFGDMQFRKVNYEILGIDDDLTPLDVKVDYAFLNPKVGITYNIADRNNAYASFAVANKEPNRGDFIDNLEDLPKPEQLYDLEFGYRSSNEKFSFEWNNYVMSYTNQLVLTGELDQSGAFIRTNAGKSSRIGSEASISVKVTDMLFWNANTTISQNKIHNEFIEDFGDGVAITHKNTEISYSPSIIAANSFLYKFEAGLEIELSTKYVGKQYLDNTSNEERKLPAYTFSNLRFGYDWDPTFLGNVRLTAMINNIFDAKYSSNGYTYSYLAGDIVTENFVYPQAGINFMLGLNVAF
ncbi:MAG: iron complex outermembrane receptor protein [Saprospiraceae bacterium]|jgi:iron complex outermembrane receptor protein